MLVCVLQYIGQYAPRPEFFDADSSDVLLNPTSITLHVVSDGIAYTRRNSKTERDKQSSFIRASHNPEKDSRRCNHVFIAFDILPEPPPHRAHSRACSSCSSICQYDTLQILVPMQRVHLLPCMQTLCHRWNACTYCYARHEPAALSACA